MAKLSLVVAIFGACGAFLVGGVAGEHREVKVSRSDVMRAPEAMIASDLEGRGPDNEKFEMLALFLLFSGGQLVRCSMLVVGVAGLLGMLMVLNLLTPSPFHNKSSTILLQYI